MHAVHFTLARTILHVDMDAFFAAVEQRDDPSLRGKPVLVGGGRGGTGKRGVVTAASYEARVFGCRSAMPMAKARALCPQAIVVPVRMSVYAGISDQIRNIFERFTPDMEPVSIDEAFLDVTMSLHLFESGEWIAREIRRLVREETRLTCSVGVAPNKFLAKLASDLRKPDGLVIMDGATAPALLAPMSVSALFGVGPKTAAKLARLGIVTIGDLLKADTATLDGAVGEQAQVWRALARGEDERPVVAGRERKSIGQEQTFGDDVSDTQRLIGVLLGQVEDTARTLRAKQLRARCITIKLRTGDFHTVTRSVSLPDATDTTSAIWGAARGLFEHWARHEGASSLAGGGAGASSTHVKPLRLLGVSLGELDGGNEPTLFAPPPTDTKRRAVDIASDLINSRFGPSALTRAGSIPRRSKL